MNKNSASLEAVHTHTLITLLKKRGVDNDTSM